MGLDVRTGKIITHGYVSRHIRGGGRKDGLHIIIPLNEKKHFSPGSFCLVELISSPDPNFEHYSPLKEDVKPQEPTTQPIEPTQHTQPTLPTLDNNQPTTKLTPLERLRMRKHGVG